MLSVQVLVLTTLRTSLYPTYASDLCPHLGSSVLCRLTVYSDTETLFSEIRTVKPDIVIDLTELLSTGFEVGQLAEQLNFYHFYSLRSDLRCYNSVQIWPEKRLQKQLIEAALGHFRWTKALIVGSSDPWSIEQVHELTHGEADVAAFIFSPESAMQDLNGSEMKSFARNILIIASEPGCTKDILETTRRKNMHKAGYAYFLLMDSVQDELWTSGCDGCFYVSPQCGSRKTTRRDFILSYFSQLVSTPASTLESFIKGRSVTVPLYLCNLHHQEVRQFAQALDHAVSFSSVQPLFPGGVLTPPGSVLPVSISISNGIANPSLPPSSEITSVFEAAYLALSDANEFLSEHNFEVLWSGVEYGCFEFERDWALSHISPMLGRLGTAIVAAPASSTSIGISRLFQDLNVTRPLIGATNTAAVLSSQSAFPWFVRVAPSDSRKGEVCAQMIRHYGWQRCSVLYVQGDVWSEGLYRSFAATAAELNILIANKEELRGLNSSSDLRQYSYQIDEVVKSKARVIVLIVFISYIHLLIEALYDSGLRKGDVLFFAIDWLRADLITSVPESVRFKYEELLEGAIMVSPLVFRGRYGSHVQERLTKLHLTPDFSQCLYYDAAMLAAQALNYLVSRGADYEDPSVMMKELRTAKFVGCSGLVYVAGGTNDRARDAFQVQNLQRGTEWKLRQVLIFDPESVQIFLATGKILWPDGNSTPPSDAISEGDCPKSLKPFLKGQLLELGICACLLLGVLAVTGYMWTRWRTVKYPRLISRHEISMEDYIMFAGLIIEFFQVLGLGPDLNFISNLASEICEAISLQINTEDVAGDLFWVALDVIFAACFAWIVLFVAALLNIFQRFRLSTLDCFSDRFLPFLSGACFLPIISQVTEVFLCDRAEEDSFGSSVLAKDCRMQCWSLQHSTYAAGCVVLLAGWVPAALLTRPLWQRLQNVLHVKTRPAFLLLSTPFHVTLVVLSKTLKRTHAVIHVAVYSLMVAGMTAWLLIARPHNYQRVNMWHAGMYAAVSWMGIVSLANELVANVLVTEIVLLSGWGLIAGVCLCLQSFVFKSLLYRRPSRDSRKLFRFAFTFWNAVRVAEVDFNQLTMVRDVEKATETLSRQVSFVQTMLPTNRD